MNTGEFQSCSFLLVHESPEISNYVITWLKPPSLARHFFYDRHSRLTKTAFHVPTDMAKTFFRIVLNRKKA
jgi:hypothetical protein